MYFMMFQAAYASFFAVVRSLKNGNCKFFYVFLASLVPCFFFRVTGGVSFFRIFPSAFPGRYTAAAPGYRARRLRPGTRSAACSLPKEGEAIFMLL